MFVGAAGPVRAANSAKGQKCKVDQNVGWGKSVR